MLPSHRGHLYVLERSRVFRRDGRVEYTADQGREARAFNIPVANTCLVLLGPGSSVTNEAMRMLREEGVLVGFCGSGGTPLLAAEPNVSDWFDPFMEPADEYREPSHLHKWIEVWREPDRRMSAARVLMRARAKLVETCWNASKDLELAPKDIRQFLDRVDNASDTQDLLVAEAILTKRLYAEVAGAYCFPDFVRDRAMSKSATDPNSLLDHGNYLAYGMASVVLWAYGIPASLSVVHGKTRRGGLVFDLADCIKDALVLPNAFSFDKAARTDGSTSVDFKAHLLRVFERQDALKTMFATFVDAMQVA